MHEAAVATALQGGSGLVVAALGAWVVTIKPRSSATLGFSAFAIGFGATIMAANLIEYTHLGRGGTVESALRLGPNLLYLGGLVVMAQRFPLRLRQEEWKAALAATLVTLLLATALVASLLAAGRSTNMFTGAHAVVDGVAFSALTGYALLLALRYRSARDEPERKLLALTCAALLLYVAFAGGRGFGVEYASSVLHAEGLRLLFAVLYAGTMFLVAGGWLVATHGAGSRTARNMALLTLALVLTGLTAAAFEVRAGELGISRLLMVFLLAYAILRHRLLGLDVKLRFALSKSTVAAAFIAVFFVAGEAAQQFFGDRFESGYLGILAAGALVFAIAPLSRLADRLAAKAVPLHAPPRTTDDFDNHEAYRVLLRRCLRDGRISRAEEVALARAAEGMTIPGHEALRLRHEIEDEQGRI